MTHTGISRPLRFAAFGAAAALSGAALIAPSIVQTPAHAVDAAEVCEVTDATLEWGVLERFRTYVLGTIANGEWTVDGNVTYDTPTFTWSDGSGTLMPDASEGAVQFEGTIHFNAHGGLLQVDLAHPTFEVVSPDEAYLLLDLKATDTSGAPAVDEEQVRAATLESAGTSTVEGEQITFANVPGVLTAEGAEAFGGFYAEGQEIDPITVTVPSCVVPEPEPEEAPEPTPEVTEEAEPEEESPAPQESEIPWLPIGIGAAALVVIAVAATLLITGRKRGSVGDAEGPAGPTDQ